MEQSPGYQRMPFAVWVIALRHQGFQRLTGLHSCPAHGYASAILIMGSLHVWRTRIEPMNRNAAFTPLRRPNASAR